MGFNVQLTAWSHGNRRLLICFLLQHGLQQHLQPPSKKLPPAVAAAEVRQNGAGSSWMLCSPVFAIHHKVPESAVNSINIYVQKLSNMLGGAFCEWDVLPPCYNACWPPSMLYMWPPS
jgi:hypothetical protein